MPTGNKRQHTSVIPLGVTPYILSLRKCNKKKGNFVASSTEWVLNHETCNCYVSPRKEVCYVIVGVNITKLINDASGYVERFLCCSMLADSMI